MDICPNSKNISLLKVVSQTFNFTHILLVVKHAFFLLLILAFLNKYISTVEYYDQEKDLPRYHYWIKQILSISFIQCFILTKDNTVASTFSTASNLKTMHKFDLKIIESWNDAALDTYLGHDKIFMYVIFYIQG